MVIATRGDKLLMAMVYCGLDRAGYASVWSCDIVQVQADILYPVGQASQHPIMENFRVQSYRQALMSQDPEACTILGELMFQVQTEFCCSRN
jgi:hypothetical protein